MCARSNSSVKMKTDRTPCSIDCHFKAVPSAVKSFGKQQSMYTVLVEQITTMDMRWYDFTQQMNLKPTNDAMQSHKEHKCKRNRECKSLKSDCLKFLKFLINIKWSSPSFNLLSFSYWGIKLSDETKVSFIKVCQEAKFKLFLLI